MINNVVISGNLCRDAELRQSQSGMQVLTFTVAVNERKRDQDGTYSDYANFIKCTMFGERAEKLAAYLTKGIKVCVCGKLHQNRWEDQQGASRSEFVIYVSDIELPPKQTQQQKQPQQREFYSDLPF